jgi:O-antigen/teichoic acid export membrane protein
VAYQIVIARHIGPAAFGLLVLGLAISKLLAEGSDLGLDYGILRLGVIALGSGEAGRFRAIVRRSIVACMVAGALSGLLLAGGSGLVASVFHKTGLTPVLVPLALAIPFTAGLEVLRAALRAMGDAKRPVASASIVTPVLRLLTGIWAVTVSTSARSVGVAYLATEAMAFAITLVMLMRMLPRGVDGENADGLFRFSLPMALNRMLLFSNNQTEVVILGILTPAATVGIFGVARRMSVMVGALLASVSILFNPIVADLHHSDRIEELGRLYTTSTRWLLTMSLPLCLAEILFARNILEIMGNDFTGGSVALAVLAVGQLVNVGTGTSSNLQAMAGFAKVTVLNSVLFLVMSIGLDLVLIPAFGIVGAAAANTGSLIVVNLLRFWQIRSRLGLVPYDRSFIRPLVAAVPAGVLAWAVPLPDVADAVQLLVRVGVLGVSYLGALVLLGFEPVDRAVARAALARLRGRPALVQPTTPGRG